MITISFLPFCCHYFTPNAITCLIFTSNCCRSASRRRKRPHGALAGLKALLAARKEKQKVKEDASGTGIAGNVDKEEETGSVEDEKAISNVDKEEAFNFNISSTTKNKTTLLEEGDKIIAVTSIAETLKEQNKDENADAEEEDKEKNKGDVSEKVKGDKPCHPLLTPEGENYDWSPLSKPVILDYEKRKNETTPVSLDENQTDLGLTNATFISDKESEQPNKEIQSIEAIVPNVVSKKESESEKSSSTKESEKGKDERRPPPFDLFVKVDPITQNQAFTEQHHQSQTISPILPSTKISEDSSKNSESATETIKDFETFPKEFHGESENNTSEGLNEPATSDDQLNKVAPFPASTQSSERESTSAASDATLLAAIKLNGPNITYTTSMGAATTNRPNTGTTLTKATVVNLATTNTNTKVNLTSTTTTIVAGLLDLLWGGQYGVNDVLLDDGTPSSTFVEPASPTNSTNDKENLNPGPDVLLPPSDLGSVDISPASGASDVEVAPNIAAIDADAGLDTLALDGLAIHSTSSIVRPTDQLHDMQTTQDHPEENNEMGNNTFPTTLVPPSPTNTSASFDDKTTQAASLLSISVLNPASIPGGPTSIPGEAYLPLATAEDPNLEVVTAAAELFVTNPTSSATSTRETDLLSASGNSKYFDKSTPAFAGNLSKVPHSTSQTKEPEQNWVEMISLEEGKGEPDLLVVLPTGTVESSTSTLSTLLPTGEVKASTKHPEPEIHKQPTVEKAEIAESRPNGENGANSSSPFWVWPTSEDPWVWI